VDELAGRGFPVFYGALGENLTTRGLDPAGLRPGQQFRAGQALIELTRIRVPCDSLAIYGAGIGREIYDRQTRRGDPASQHWGRSGFYARVLEPGRVRPQDIITLVSMLA